MAGPSEPVHVLAVGAWSPVVERLWAAGAETSLLCDAEMLDQHQGLSEHRSVTVTRAAGLEELVALAEGVHARAPLSHAVSFDDTSMVAAARIREGLGLGGGDPSAVVGAVHDKDRYRSALTGTPAAVPHAVVGSVHDVLRFGRTHGWPVVVKPVSGSGSAGVTLGVGPDGAADALARATVRTHYTPTGRAMAEVQVRGRVITVDTLSHAGAHEVMSIGFELPGAAHPAMMIYGVPAPLTDTERRDVVGTVTSALARLGVTTGPAHTELLLTAEGTPVLVETQLRPGGDFPELTLAASGLDVYDAWARQLLGEDPLPRVREAAESAGTCAVIACGAPDVEADYLELRDLDEVRAHDDVAGVRVLRQPPYRSASARTRDDLSVTVMSTAPTARLALRRAVRALGGARMRVTTHGGGGAAGPPVVGVESGTTTSGGRPFKSEGAP